MARENVNVLLQVYSVGMDLVITLGFTGSVGGIHVGLVDGVGAWSSAVSIASNLSSAQLHGRMQ